MTTPAPAIPDPTDRSLLGLIALGLSEGKLDRYAPPEHRQYLSALNAPGRDPLKWTADEQAWAAGWRRVCDAAKSPGRRLFELNRERSRREANRLLNSEERPQPKSGLVFDGDETLAAMEWLADRLVPAEGAGELFGESDVGKTFVGVSLGVHVAAGIPWMGHAVKQGTVLFYEAEGGRAFARRKHAAKGAAGLGDSLGGDLFHRLPFVTVYQPLGFGADTDVALAVNEAVRIRSEIAAKELPPIRLVVVDTLSQNMSGDADSNEEMQAFLRVFRAFLKSLSDGPVFGLLIHHPGHSVKDRGRGAYSLPADLDLIAHLEDAGAGALNLVCKRMRDDVRFDPIPLRLDSRIVTVDGEPMPDAQGRKVSSLVVVPADTTATAQAPVVRDDVLDAVLRALPDYPEKVGVQAYLVPKVGSMLGRNVDHKTVATKCFVLQARGLAEYGPGREKDSKRWGKAKPPKPEAQEPGDM